MNIERAKEIALAAWPANMGAAFFFITNDEQCYTNPNDAVIQAVKLSAGNPEVMTVRADELELPEGFEAPAVTNETITNARIAAMDALEAKIKELTAEIIKLDTPDEINDENHAAKMHVANLKEQLKTAATEYAAFDPTDNGQFDKTVVNLVGQLLNPEMITAAPEDTKETVVDTLLDAVNNVALVNDEATSTPADQAAAPVNASTPPADDKKDDEQKAEGTNKKRNNGNKAITE